MILADCFVWIDHLRRVDPQMVTWLDEEQIVGHTFVTGEVSLGSLADRGRVIARLTELPQLRLATTDQVQHLIVSEQLWGKGIGYVDAHLLAAVLLTSGTSLWTRDKRLHAVASGMNAAAP